MSTNQILNVQVRGTDSGFSLMMNRINSGLSRMGQGLRSTGSQGNVFSNQLKAIGTTARYALAGQFVFGVRAAINNLAEFKTQLGDLNALASKPGANGQLQGLGKNLDVLGTQAILMSNKFGVAVPEVEAYMQRFYTAFKPKGSAQQTMAEATKFVNAHLELVTILGSRAGDPNKLAGGIASLAKLLPGGDAAAGSNAETVSNWLAKIVQSTPNLTGEDVANAAGRLASAKTLSGMSPQQVMAAFGLAATTGGSSAVVVRGMTQLLGASLLHPTKKESVGLYDRVFGTADPNKLRDLGGEKVLEGLIKFVNPSGKKGDVNKLNLDAVYNAFGRQESVRQFVNLIANGGVEGLKAFNKQLSDANDGLYAHKAAELALSNQILKRAGIARQNIGLGLARALQTPLEGVGLMEIGASNLINKHQTTTQAAVGTAFGLAGLNALRKMGTFGRFGKGGGKFGNFLSGVGSAERGIASAAITSEELSPGGTVLSGAAGDGSRANPLWVIISPLSWSLGGPDSMGGGGGGGFGGTGLLGLGGLSKSPWLKRAGLVGAVLTADQILRATVPGIKKFEDGGPSWSDIGHGLTRGPHTTWGGLRKRGFTQGQVLKLLEQTPANLKTPLLRALDASHISGTALKHIQVSGQANADLVIKLVDDHGKVIKIEEKKGIPVKIWGAHGAPTTKGKTAKRKAT